MATFVNSIRSLHALVLTQRSARLLLRALWTGLAGYLIGWGLNRLAGVPETSLSWVLIALLLALPSLIAIFRPLPMARLAWRLDRLFGLKEQVSTAWQHQGHTHEGGSIAGRLFDDAAALLPAQRQRIFRRGWFLGKDAESLAIVLLLGIAVLLFGQFNTLFTIPDAQTQELPPLDQPPSASDVFPSGIPGTGNPAGSDQGGSEGGEEALTPSQVGNIGDILEDLGQSLGQFPETSAAGQALETGDLDEAASQIEGLADNIELLPAEARENLQESLERAAARARETGQDDLAEALENAATALEDPESGTPPADALDQLADALRDLGASLTGPDPSNDPAASESSDPLLPTGNSAGAAGAGSGDETLSEPEPLSRLEGEGGEVVLEAGEDPSGLLSPGGSTSPTTVGSGPSGGTSPSTSTTTINSILTPYTLPWRWLDVVSQYFSR